MKRKLILAFALFASHSAQAISKAANEISVVSSTTKLTGNKSAISGRIVDENKEPLPGAVITIDDLEIGAIADARGFFYIANVKPGTHTVSINYIGYTPLTSPVTFEEGTAMEATIKVVAGIEIGSIEVKGIVSGRRKALQQQKSEIGVSNVISADQMERFPDENIGDAMKRIPGINVQYDQGEARFGQIRGTAPDLSSVTVNGNRTPSAEGDTRSAQLDLIPADMIETVEVRKVVTSDMDGDAIGGAVNLITKSAPSRATLNTNVGVGYNPISGKMTYNGGVTAGKRFFDDKFGIVAAISYINNAAGSDNIEAEWKEGDNGVYMNEFQNRQYFVHRERQSYSLSTDYKFNANHSLEFKGMYNRRNDWENRYRLKIKLDEPNDDNVALAKSIERETKGGGKDERYSRLERQETQSYNLAGKHNFSFIQADWNIDYSTASEVRPNERYITMEKKSDKLDDNDNKIAGNDYYYLNINTSDENQPKVSANSINPDVLNISQMDFDKVEQSFEDTREKEFKAAVNFKADLTSGLFGNTLRFGYKLQNKVKSKTINYYEAKPTDNYESTFETSLAKQFTDQTRQNYMAGDYKIGSFVNREYLGNLNLNNSENWEKTKNLTEQAGGYRGKESNNAVYFRYDQKLGDKVSAILGLRLENTYSKYKGNNIQINGDGQLAGNAKEDIVERTVNNWLPSFLVKYNANDNIIVRGSYTTTIARPKFSNLVPGKIWDESEEEIIEGNPYIKNTISNNFDIMGEYYSKDAGIISAGIYYKGIKGFIVESVIEDTETGLDKKQAVNGGNGYILGFEASVQRDLSFISKKLKNFGLYANYTYNYSKVTEITSERLIEQNTEQKLPGSPAHTLNASLYYENKLFSTAVSYNFASSFLDEMGGNAFENRYYDKVNYLDVNVSVKATNWLTVYAEVNNILNQPLRYYQGEGATNRVMQMEYYGVKSTIGLKAKF